MDIDLVQKAWEVAEKAHRNQYYGSDIPYLYHLGKVFIEASKATINYKENKRTEILLSAILHDSLEDTDINEYFIADKFGTEVMLNVKALTKDDSLSKNLQMQDSLSRIKKRGQSAAVVKLCDRISNLSQAPPNHWEPDWILSYKNESELILSELEAYDDFLSLRLKEIISFYEKEYLK